MTLRRILAASALLLMLVPVVPAQESGILEEGASWSYTFATEGEQAYHCHPHPEMTGLVRVEDTEEALSGEVAVIIRDMTFAPALLTVKPGTTVTWTNEDALPHTVTFHDEAHAADHHAGHGAHIPAAPLAALFGLVAMVALARRRD